MTSVNSPACLLARNHFYRNLPSSPEPSSAVFTCHNDSARHKQRQVTLWVTMATPPAFTGGTETKRLGVNIVLGFPSSPPFSTSKPTNPAERDVK